jgi:hypothetical protein
MLGVILLSAALRVECLPDDVLESIAFDEECHLSRQALSGLHARILGQMRTFLALALALSMGHRAVGAQSPAGNNPCVQPGQTSPRLLPVDEAATKPDFLAYRARLRTAVEKRDTAALIDASDPGIRLGFDASGGSARLRTMFSERPELWEELRAVLALGGSFSSPTAFAAPYVYSRWPSVLDSFECAAVVGRNVRLRMSPQLDGRIVTTVSHSIVRLLQTGAEKQWSSVRLGDGRMGYIWHAYVRSPVDYRALFNLIDGRWRMTAFVAGD